jgi:hypothetical protein
VLQNQLLEIKPDVANEIVTNIPARQVLLMDFVASNVKIRRELISGEAF